MKKRVLSMLMVLVMVLSMVPVMAGAATATPEITQVSMTLNGILDVNFKVASNGADMSKCSVVITGAAAQTITSHTRDGDLYVYTAKVPAHKLPETMTVSLMLDGATVQTQDWTAGPDYLSKLTGSNELTALASALQNYGIYAAAYAAGTASEEIDGITAAELIDYKPVITVNGNLAAMASLYLDDAADLRVKFNEAAWVEGYQLKVDGDDATAVSDGNGKLVYTKAGLLPQDWSHMYDIKVVNGDTVVYQVSYSVNSYVYQALSRSTEAATGLNNLLKSMYSYGTAANAYAPASKTPITLANLPLRDPFILNDGDAYYMYGTKDNGCFYVWSSTDLVNWYAEGKCFEVDAGDDYYDTTNSEIAFWAPEVFAYNGAYYMFATFTQAGTNNQQATAILKADSPVGPFTKWSDGFVTPAGHSALDGTLYIENGTPYMIYCHEHQCTCLDGTGTMDYIQLSADLKSTVGESKQLFAADQFSWGPFYNKKYSSVTDGCHVYTKDGVNYLQWSTNIDGVYNTVYTTFDTIAGGVSGTHTKLYTNDGGHGMIFTDMNGIDKLVLHTPNSSTSYPAIFNVTTANGTLALENVNFINFAGVDGAINNNASSYEDGATTELAPLTGRSNATFIGWFDAEGNQVTSLAGKDGNLTLTAKWETADLAALDGATGIYTLTDNVTVSATVSSFNGTLNGSDKTVSTTAPLFEAIGPGTVIENLTIDLTADLESTGILCSSTSAVTDLTLTDIAIISSNGSVLNGTGDCGAFMAKIGRGSVITGCSNAVDVNRTATDADIKMGGLFAYTENGPTITNCSNSGDITGISSWRAYVGGIVGDSYGTSYTNCDNTGNIGNDYCSGGIVGVTRSDTVDGCTNSGTVSGEAAGGIVGRLEGGDITVKNCASNGNIVATTEGGSLAGQAANFSTVSFKGNTFGENTVTVGGIEYSAANLLYPLNMNADKLAEDNEQTNGDTTVWITALSQLEGKSGTFYLAADITANTTIVSNFSGTLIGNGHTISTSTPLFSAIGTGSKIQDLTVDLTANINAAGVLCTGTLNGVTVENVSIISSNNSTLTYNNVMGAFAPYAKGNSAFINCSNAVNITNTAGNTYTAGIVAQAEGNMTFTNCSNSGNITTPTNSRGTGGIIGHKNNGGTATLTGCKNSGALSGGVVGGLIGRMDNVSIVIRNSVSTGNITSGGTDSGSLVGAAINGTKLTFVGNTFGNNTVTQGSNVYAAENIVQWMNTSSSHWSYTADNEQFNTFVITYNLDGGSMSEPTTVTVAQGTTVNLTAEPTKAGYSFLGWSYNGSTVTSVTVNGNITLTAQWQTVKPTYTVTYNLDGGANNAANLTSYEADTVVTLADATKADYMFIGWFDENGNQVTTITVDRDITLTAKWALYIYDLLDLEDGTGAYALAEDIEGYGVSSFSGTLYGNGHTISISEPLFEAIGSGAVIQDLTIDLTDDLNAQGILCAGTLNGVTVKGVSIISTNDSMLSYATGGQGKIGAFAPTASGKSVFIDCSNAVDVTNTSGNAFAGGFVGQCEGDMTFTNCVNSGNITGSDSDGGARGIGGIVGHKNNGGTATLSGCTNSGIITGRVAGGFVGRMDGVTVNVHNCTAIGDIVSKDDHPGSLLGVGINSTKINITGENTFGNNTVTNGATVYAASERLHGSNGSWSYISGSQQNNMGEVYTITYSLDGGTNTGTVITGFTAAAAANVKLPTPAKVGYKFTGWKIGSTSITSLAGYSSNVTLTATWVEGAIAITSLSELDGKSGSYELTGNITGNSHTVTNFSGSLEGNGYTISTSVPLFSAIGSGSKVQNLTVDLTADVSAAGILCTGTLDNVAVSNVTVKSTTGKSLSYASGNAAPMGGFAKIAKGNSVFTNCSNQVNITNTSGNAFTGGIVGQCEGNMTFTNCSNTGNITTPSGSRGTGGIIGHKNNGGTATLTGCSNSGALSGGVVGGFVGRMDGVSIVIKNSASTGNITSNSTDAGSLVGAAINGTKLTFVGNTFGNNTVSHSNGSAVYTAQNCIQWANTSSSHWSYTADNEQTNNL